MLFCVALRCFVLCCVALRCVGVALRCVALCCVVLWHTLSNILCLTFFKWSLRSSVIFTSSSPCTPVFQESLVSDNKKLLWVDLSDWFGGPYVHVFFPPNPRAGDRNKDNNCNIRVGQITLFFSKRLVSMAKFDVDHESVNRFYVWWRLIALKSIRYGRPKWRNLQENGNFHKLLARNMSFCRFFGSRNTILKLLTSVSIHGWIYMKKICKFDVKMV